MFGWAWLYSMIVWEMARRQQGMRCICAPWWMGLGCLTTLCQIGGRKYLPPP